MKKKACKQCRLLIMSGDECPHCKGSTFVPNWKGRMIILNHKESQVAKKVNILADGEFAIKVS